MKVMVIVKGDTGPDELPAEQAEQMFAAMGRYNEKLVDAGVMLDGAGLMPSSEGRRVRFEDGGTTSVVDGPFAGAEDLVAGFWIWQVDSIDHAVEWARKAPFGVGEQLEIRPVAEAQEDLGEGFTDELKEREDQLRERLANR